MVKAYFAPAQRKDNLKMNETITKNCTTVQGDLCLSTLLGGCKKNRIKAVAARYDVKAPDKLTKQQITEAALPVIEINFGIKVKQYSRKDMKILLNCIECGGIDEETALEVIDSEPFKDGAIFLTAKKDKISTIVPKDLAGKAMMHCASHCMINGDDNITRTAKVCAMIYGSFTPEMLVNAVNGAYTDMNMTVSEADEFLAGADCEQFTYANGVAVYAPAKPAQISALAANLDYSLPTRREIEAYSIYGLDSTGYYYRQIVNFVYNNQNGSYEKANELMKKISVWCLTSGSVEDIFSAIQQSEMAITPGQFEFLLNMIGELSDRTRKQSLKGHRHCDVEGTQPSVMPGIVAGGAEGNEHNSPVRVEQKIGRNDLCPCGSGKKYKKCCGKASHQM